MPQFSCIYRPENGMEKVECLRNVLGSSFGAQSYDARCVFYALKLQDGKEILVKQSPFELAAKTDEFLHTKLEIAMQNSQKQSSRAVLILNGGGCY